MFPTDTPPASQRAIALRAKLEVMRGMATTLRGMINRTDTFDDDQLRYRLRNAITRVDGIINDLDAATERVSEL